MRIALLLALSTLVSAVAQQDFKPAIGQPGKDVVWVPTSPELVEKMLDLAKVTAEDFVIDLGSGDGRMVIAAAKRGARALGVEFNPEMVKLSKQRALEAGVAERASFVEGDMYEADISKATVLTLFLLSENLRRLEPKFRALPAGTRIVVNTFAIPEWTPEASETISDNCTTWCTALLYRVPPRAAAARQGAREISVTIDDLPWMPYGGPIDVIERDTTRLLAALERHRIPAIGFVNENKLLVDGVVDERRVALLKQWIGAGQELGNHTFSHRDLHSTPAHVFQAEIERGDDITARLLALGRKRPRYFRHPFLHTGRSLETRAQVEKFLAQSGYRVAPVTIDNYDYLFARAHHLASAQERPRIERAYVDYMTAVVGYYEQQSAAIVGREIRQILLLHANGLNAQTLPALATMLEQRGYTFVTLDRALEDPAYQSADQFTGAGGITWLHRWAMTRGMRGAIFRGEPVVPDWIQRSAQDR